MELKEIIFNMWKTGFYQSKLDIIAAIEEKYNIINEKNMKNKIIKNVEEVLSNIDKYEIKFKQLEKE